MIYAEFWHPAANDPDRLIPACGDRAVVVIDARLRMGSIVRIAREECRKRGYQGYSLHRGRGFSNSAVIAAMQEV